MRLLACAGVAAAASAFSMKLPALPTLDATVVGSVSVCSSGDALAKNFVATSNSTSPKVGEFVGLTFDYDIGEDITEGATAAYSCTINGFLPYSTKSPICVTDGSEGSPPCPMEAGHRTDEGAIEVASGVSKLKCTITWSMGDGREILCATASWTVA